jgi:ribulose-phosphate 3-epimerase
MLSASFTNLGEELAAVERAGADCIHWDIMDGNFVEAITFGHRMIAAHRKLSQLRFDAHLMVVNPERHIKNFAQAGADVISVHAEVCKDLHHTLGFIRLLGKKSGVALNPATSIEILEYCSDVLDQVVIMSVNPGNSGQSFIASQLNKILELRKTLPQSVEICVDGGITDQTIGDCVRCGADSCVSGSYVFRSQSYVDALRKLRESCN